MNQSRNAEAKNRERATAVHAAAKSAAAQNGADVATPANQHANQNYMLLLAESVVRRGTAKR